MKPCPGRINPICIERKHNHRPFQRETLDEIYLSSCVHLNIDVIESRVVALVHFNVKLRGVLKHKVMNGSEVTIHETKEVRPQILVRQPFLIIEKNQDPPMVATTVYLASSRQLNVCASVKGNKVLIVSWPL
jgi:hypothetical protein